ncbi:MAG: MFS transporter [Burkholderiales bacterium]|jgi:predicted MFS family arabinose efflux permease|nr:MFS transporter [Burkholderiales bacterium]
MPTPTLTQAAPHTPELPRLFLPLMAVACGVAVANIYYMQPLLEQLARSFQTTVAGIAAIPTATQVGFACGLIGLGPLGDRHPRHRVILGMGAALVFMLLLVSAAPTIALLTLASLGVGLMASIAQQIVPLVAHLAPPQQRGRAVGLVMSGLLVGILGGRVVGGLVGQALGWRAVFALAALLNAASLAMLWRTLPRLPANDTSAPSYAHLVASTLGQFRKHAELRAAGVTGGLFFGAFSVFWVGLTPLLGSPAYGLGPAAAGLFGILGLSGALVAPVSGRHADHPGGPRRVLLVALVGVLASWALFALGSHGLVWLVLGVVVLDAGVQGAQIANQTRIYALDAASRSRINAVYMTQYFIGGAAGTYAASHAWALGGWPAVVFTGAAFSALALVLHATWNPSPASVV